MLYAYTFKVVSSASPSDEGSVAQCRAALLGACEANYCGDQSVDLCVPVDDAAACMAEREAQLWGALPDPDKLDVLATWIDVMYPDDSNPEVQRDLRRWADAIRAALAAREGV